MPSSYNVLEITGAKRLYWAEQGKWPHSLVLALKGELPFRTRRRDQRFYKECDALITFRFRNTELSAQRLCKMRERPGLHSGGFRRPL
jgi:hypothetical protein